MQPSVRDNYLETEVMTATPQKLQLMLLEAAIRNILRTKASWDADQDEQACETLIRAQQIVTQLISALNPEVDSGLAKKVASVYIFVFRSLVDASVSRDVSKLDDALKVLETERDTWKMVCDKLSAEAAQENDAAVARLSTLTAPSTPPSGIPPSGIPPSGIPPSGIPPLPDDNPLPGTSSGFSLEA